ncbi:MAG: IclR family transcriptional regulator [Novosphingobium sp.]
MPADAVVKSVGRVFAVMELFARRREGLSATELERALDYPKSSTLALLKSMVALGYLSYDRIERTYFPTVRVHSLGHWICQAESHRELDGLMQDAAAATGETVTLSCQNDLKMQFMTVVSGSNPLMLNFRPGMTGPLFKSNMGLVALAQNDDAEIRRLAERMNRRAGSRGERVDDLPGTMRRIAEIRRAGYGIGYRNYVDFVGVISWPILGADNSRPLVLSIGGPVEAIQAAEQDIIAKMTKLLTEHGHAMQGR